MPPSRRQPTGGCRPAGAAGYIVADLSGAVRLKRRFDRERESFGLLQNVLYKGNEHGCDTIPPSLQLSKLLLTCTIRPVSQSFCVYTACTACCIGTTYVQHGSRILWSCSIHIHTPKRSSAIKLTLQQLCFFSLSLLALLCSSCVCERELLFCSIISNWLFSFIALRLRLLNELNGYNLLVMYWDKTCFKAEWKLKYCRVKIIMFIQVYISK